MTTSASRSLIPWSVTIAGTMPRRKSSRARRSAMFVTIWTWTHEWSVSPSRAALTPATCHHAFTWGSALTASMSWSSRRLPRVGARMRIAAIASAGEARDGGAGGRASTSSCIDGSGYFDDPGAGSRVLPRQCEPAGAVVEHRRSPPGGRAVRRADRHRLAGAQHDLAADRDRRVGVELAVAAQHDARHEAVGERGARLQAVALGVEDVHLRRPQADRLARVVDDAPEQQMVGGGLADGRRARRRLPPQRAAGLRGVPAEPARGEHREDRHDRRDAEDPSHVASLERTGVRDLAHFAAEIDGDRASSGHRA